MNIPENLHYTPEHEWLRIENGIGVIGITDYAQGELGDIVFVTLPEVGKKFAIGDTIGTVEAVKAAADIYAPVSGEVVAVNEALETSAEIVNQSPYEDGWVVRIKIADPSEVLKLLDAVAYRELVARDQSEA